MSGRRWNVLFWVAMLAVLGGSAASLVVWPVHRRGHPAAERMSTQSVKVYRPWHPHAASRPATPFRPPSANGRVKLYVFAARGPSRVLVRRSTSNGQVLFNATLADGGTLKIAGPRLYAQVSDIANVDVRVNSRMLDMTCTAAAGVILTGTRAIPTQAADCPKPSSGS